MLIQLQLLLWSRLMEKSIDAGEFEDKSDKAQTITCYIYSCRKEKYQKVPPFSLNKTICIGFCSCIRRKKMQKRTMPDYFFQQFLPLTMLNQCKLMIFSSMKDYFIVAVVFMGLCKFMGMDNDPSCTWPPCPCSHFFLITLNCLQSWRKEKENSDS